MTGNFKSSCKSLKLPFYISKKASAATDICQYRYYERHKRSLIFFAPKIKSGLPLDKNGFMLIQEQRSRIVRFKNQEDKP